MKPHRLLGFLSGAWLTLGCPAAEATPTPPRDLGFAHTREYAIIGTNVYSYLLSEPSPAAAVDPHLTALGYRVVAPDMLGYGRTNAPLDTKRFSLKNMSDDLARLVKKVAGNEQVILGGHDWGGAMVYRAALWHPELYKGIFSVCTPYFPPTTQYVDLKDQIAAGITPSFGYQLQLREPAIDLKLLGSAKIRQVLLALYGATTPAGQPGFDARTGLLFDNMPKLGSSPLVSDADVSYYTTEYLKNTMRGPLNWYRTAQVNFQDELALLRTPGGINFTMPGLYVGATLDTALPPSMSVGMEKYFPKGGLTRGEVVASHWALWHAARDVNVLLGQWISGLEAASPSINRAADADADPCSSIKLAARRLPAFSRPCHR
ncbi:unnamed protein product [Parascedosporium putredinis]|uniref:AB hydrolase-1 domain-containing protein n=1 Tax=Parascedosporium putredinis TaxID=1442378 RepID=A0A9P1MB62_9PEZI|nr:unnamed protein product [Parascedosporium putredinis]CAI7994022.1 unnamed protein product [Parascedosporium putredinis]